MNQIGDEADEVFDPTATPLRLAEILSSRPDLASAIADHPNAYPELLGWIAANAETGAQGIARQRLSGGADQGATAPVAAVGAVFADLPAPVVLSTPRRRPRRGVIIGIVAGVTALALAGGAFAIVAKLRGGAPTPEAAAQQMIDGILGGDLLALAGVIAPSERDYLSPVTSEAAKIPGGGGSDYLALATSLRDVAKPRVDDLVFETEQLADGIVAVRALGGTVALDGDPQEIAAALTEFQRSYYQSSGYEGADLDRMMVESAEQKLDWIRDVGDLEWDVADIAEGLRGNSEAEFLSLVAVDEGGWFISPLLSLGEATYNASVRAMGDYDYAYEIGERGDAVVSAKSFPSAEDALDGFMDGMAEAYSGHGVETLAAALPLPERRLLSIYRGYGFVGYGNWVDSPDVRGQGYRLQVLRRSVTRDETDDGVVLFIDEMTIETFHSGESDGAFTITRSGWFSQYSDYNLFDDEFLRGLGIVEFRVAVARDGSGWQVSPLATLRDYGVTAIRAFADRLKRGGY